MTSRTERAGILAVDKPQGPSSHDVVAAARRALGVRRIGHTGTLDPFASGLLLLCVGWATRLAEYLADRPKRYQAVAELGVSTDTDDGTGTVLTRSDSWRTLPDAEVRAAFEGLRGRIEQRPPVYSAKKIAGERAYRRARRGEAVTLEPVVVEVFALDIEAIEPPLVRFSLECSSGTYVRAIARDAGERLGTGAYLASLRRTAIGDVAVDSAVPVASLGDPAAVAAAWRPPLAALSHMPRFEVEAPEAERIRHGMALTPPAAAPESQAAGPDAEGRAAGPIAVVCGGDLIAVAEWADGRLRPRKVFPGA